MHKIQQHTGTSRIEATTRFLICPSRKGSLMIRNCCTTAQGSKGQARATVEPEALKTLDHQR
jgi:hypothetical protein